MEVVAREYEVCFLWILACFGTRPLGLAQKVTVARNFTDLTHSVPPWFAHWTPQYPGKSVQDMGRVWVLWGFLKGRWPQKKVGTSESRAVTTLTWEDHFISVFLPRPPRAPERKVNSFSYSIHQQILVGTGPGAEGWWGRGKHWTGRCMFIHHSFNDYLLSAHWGPEPVLSAKNHRHVLCLVTQSDRHRFKSQICPLGAGCPWASWSTSLCFSFHACKIRVIVVAIV